MTISTKTAKKKGGPFLKTVGIGCLGMFVLLVGLAAYGSTLPKTPTPTIALRATAVAQVEPVATATTKQVSTNAAPTVAPKPTATTVASSPTPTAIPASYPIHKVSESVSVGGHIFQLLSAKKGSTVTVEMLITNGERAVDLLDVRFDTMYLRDSAGHQYAYVYPKTGSWFEGKVLPGDKLKGTVEFSTDKPLKDLRFYYRPARFSNKDTIVFSLDDQPSEHKWDRPDWVDQSKPLSAVSRFALGESVNMGGLAVRVTAAQSAGNKATFDVIMYNGKTSDVSVRLTDTFVSKDAEGNQGEFKQSFNYTDTMGIPGTDIIKGDISTGTLTFEFKQPIAGSAQLYVIDGKNAAIYPSK